MSSEADRSFNPWDVVSPFDLEERSRVILPLPSSWRKSQRRRDARVFRVGFAARARAQRPTTFTADHPRTFHSALTLPVFRIEMQGNGDVRCIAIDDPIGIELSRSRARELANVRRVGFLSLDTRSSEGRSKNASRP